MANISDPCGQVGLEKERSAFTVLVMGCGGPRVTWCEMGVVSYLCLGGLGQGLEDAHMGQRNPNTFGNEKQDPCEDNVEVDKTKHIHVNGSKKITLY